MLFFRKDLTEHCPGHYTPPSLQDFVVLQTLLEKYSNIIKMWRKDVTVLFVQILNCLIKYFDKQRSRERERELAYTAERRCRERHLAAL